MFGKQGFNIKIRDDKDLHGRTQIKLRADARDATYLRTKLASDIHYRLGLPTVTANFANLYINDEFMGFYILEDTIKKSWIEYTYGEKDTTGLYECPSTKTNFEVSAANKCVNENKDVTDNSDLVELFTVIENAKSMEEIEEVFDIDVFLKEMAYEYLVGSWDHFLLYGHNYYLYKQQNGKWVYLITDFDGDIGQEIAMGFASAASRSNVQLRSPDSVNYEEYSFDEWAYLPRHIIDVLIREDPTRFNAILENIVNEVFNPAVLFPRIDELKEFIRPYVLVDKTLNEKGQYPGILHEIPYSYTLAHWEANSEFTTIQTLQKSLAYGLKYWILAKYRYVCTNYNIECDPVYMDENYQYSIDESVVASPTDDLFVDFDIEPKQFTTVPSQQPTESITDEPSEPTESVTEAPKECWSERFGYSCCQSSCHVYEVDDDGEWGYENHHWCGIPQICNESKCWSERFGYPCCQSSCHVYEVDDDGKWGYENHHWCGILEENC